MPTAPRNPAAPITTLRLLFANFCGAIVLISVIVVVLGESGRDDPPVAWSVAIVVAVGVVAVAASRRLARRLDGSTDESLVTSYRTRFFVRMACSEAAALAGFAVNLTLGPWWVYFVGLPFTVVGFALAAPTAGNIERDQAALRAEGCHRPLGRLLGVRDAGLVS